MEVRQVGLTEVAFRHRTLTSGTTPRGARASSPRHAAPTPHAPYRPVYQ